jgi:2-succinyl-5-enolpyruvyl-6-hydroxy-3-cyclohexene-1-carboxylate synthase
MAAAAHSGARVHVEIDERSAGFFALGLGRLTGVPAAVITTSGTAAVNLHPAIVEADLAGVPLLALTADRPGELREVGANQTIDQVGLYGGSVRWFLELGVAEDLDGSNRYWRSTASRAVSQARGAGRRAGPVHLNLPFREPLIPASDDGRVVADPFTSSVEGRPGGRPWTAHQVGGIASVELDAELITSERGMVVVGDVGSHGYEDSRQALLQSAVRLSEQLQWPLVCEPVSGHRPAGSITTAHHLLSHPGFVSSQRPDAAVVFGRVGISRALASALSAASTIVVDPWGWADPTRNAHFIAAGIPRLGDVPPRSGLWLDRWNEAELLARTALDGWLDSNDLTEPRVARDVARAGLAGVLCVASSMPVRDLDWFMEGSEIHVVANRGASGIDGFVSTVLGVAAVEERPVTALAGDLSMLHDMNGFLLRDRPECVFVVINNDGGGIFSMLPQAQFPEDFELVFGTPHGRSFQDLARLHRLAYELVESPDRLGPAIHAGHDRDGITLIEVRTSRSHNVDAHRAATSAVHDALTAAGW